MTNTRLPNSIFFMLIVLGAAQFLYYSPRLPEIVGSHFGTSGMPNGWQPKIIFLFIELIMIVLATVISFGPPRIISAMPISLINLPNKAYWLSAERREDTLSYFRRWSAWLGCGLLAFLLFVMELVFRANLHAPPQFNNAAFIPALLVFVAFDTIAVLRLILHFAKTPRVSPFQ